MFESQIDMGDDLWPIIHWNKKLILSDKKKNMWKIILLQTINLFDYYSIFFRNKC